MVPCNLTHYTVPLPPPSKLSPERSPSKPKSLFAAQASPYIPTSQVPKSLETLPAKSLSPSAPNPHNSETPTAPHPKPPGDLDPHRASLLLLLIAVSIILSTTSMIILIPSTVTSILILFRFSILYWSWSFNLSLFGTRARRSQARTV